MKKVLLKFKNKNRFYIILLYYFLFTISTSQTFAQNWNNAGVNYSTGSLSLGSDHSLGTTDKLYIQSTGGAHARALFGATGSGWAGIYFDASNGDWSGNDYGSLIQKDDLSIELNNYGINPIYFRTNKLNRLTILGNGNVGIGTTSPQTKLDVVGKVTVLSGAERLYWGSKHDGTTNHRSFLAPRKADNSDWDWAQEFGYHNYHRAWYFESNVGMGTVDPQEKLDVVGNIKLSGVIKRSNHHIGHLQGLHTTILNSKTKTNPIFTLGASYNPSESTLSSMFGIGYTKTEASFINSTDLKVTPESGWGLYIASNGKANIFLNSNNGTGYFKGDIHSQNLTTRGDINTTGWIRVKGTRGIFFQDFGGGFHMIDNTWVKVYGGKSFFHQSGIMRTDGTFHVGQGGNRFTVLTNGNVGIGITNPQSKLSVNGEIRATKVKVLADIAVPDYVFEEDYKLRSLQETKNYIQKNKHLPEIPSAKEIEKDGINLGEMNLRLLKKIEELTLYQIELLEKLEKQEKRLQKLESENNHK